MGDVLFPHVVQKVITPLSIQPTFANNTWANIIRACQQNKVPASWAVGDQKPLNIGGAEYLIDIIGKNHDDYADGSGKAPLTFQLHTVYPTMYGMNATRVNGTSWNASNMRQTHLPAILALMPTEVQTAIREVNKNSSRGVKNTTIITTADKLFLLSEVEVTNGTILSFEGEGQQYEYYAAGNSVIKKLNGEAKDWWLRSPYKGDNSSFCAVDFYGNAAGFNADHSMGFAVPAFCF